MGLDDMNDMKFEPSMAPPLPNTLEDALAEIETLRRIMFQERVRHANLVVKAEKDGRANAGQMKALKKKLEDTKADRDRTVAAYVMCDAARSKAEDDLNRLNEHHEHMHDQLDETTKLRGEVGRLKEHIENTRGGHLDAVAKLKEQAIRLAKLYAVAGVRADKAEAEVERLKGLANQLADHMHEMEGERNRARDEVTRLAGEVGKCDDCDKPAGIKACLGCYEKRALKAEAEVERLKSKASAEALVNKWGGVLGALAKSERDDLIAAAHKDRDDACAYSDEMFNAAMAALGPPSATRVLKVDALVDTIQARMAELVDLRAWQVAVAEGMGYLNRPEGQDGYEVAAPEVILAAWREARTTRPSKKRGKKAP